jgi:hypothetical protein
MSATDSCNIQEQLKEEEVIKIATNWARRNMSKDK